MTQTTTVSRRRSKGFTLIATALTIIVLLGMLGVAFDIGRAYIAKNEAQTFTDSASIDATLELDGTLSGIDRARARVPVNTNRWNFSSKSFTSWTITFAKEPAGPWETNPLDAREYRLARVTTAVQVPLTFIPIATGAPAMLLASTPRLTFGPTTMQVRADSKAGQEQRRGFRDGLLPFSPYAHDNVGPHFGLVPGQSYTLRWAANPRLSNGNVCEGDRDQRIIDLAEAGGGSERGYIEENSASVIRDSIIYNYQTIYRGIGDVVEMTGGAKQTIRDALINRVHQDRDQDSETYAEYTENSRGNGRRLVGVPINDGYPTNRIVQIGAFLLHRTDRYAHGGNQPFCAEYVGAWVQGSDYKGAEDAGAYVVRLVR